MIWPDGRAVRLKYLFTRRDIKKHAEWPLLSIYRDLGVVPRAGRDDNYNKPGNDLEAYLFVRQGDLVLNKMKTWQGSIAISNYDGIVSPAYFVASPLTADDQRYLHYLLRSQPLIAEYGARSKGIRPSQWDLSWDGFGDIRVALPPIDTQRAIANYLDRETALLDAVMSSKESLIRLLDEREDAVLDNWVVEQETRWGRVKLRRLIAGVEQGFSPECDDYPAETSEWGVLKTSAVSRGSFDGSENKRLPLDIAPDPRWVVRDGDLLVVRGSGSPGAVAQAAVADTRGRKLLLSDLIYRLHPTSASPAFLAQVLVAPRIHQKFEAQIRTDVGLTRKVRVDDLKDAVVPCTPLEEQPLMLQKLCAGTAPLRQLRVALSAQLRLVSERRRSLITAAVTGELKVPSVAV